MFNKLKRFFGRLFCRPEESGFYIISIAHSIEIVEEDSLVKPKRKYVKSGKYIKKNKKKGAKKCRTKKKN